MARESSAAIAMATIGPTGIEQVGRAPPPDNLTEEQREVWLTIVNRMPADWFPAETHDLLAQYCRHVTRARRIAELLTRMEARPEIDGAEYRQLLSEESRQSTMMCSLATR